MEQVSRDLLYAIAGGEFSIATDYIGHIADCSYAVHGNVSANAKKCCFELLLREIEQILKISIDPGKEDSMITAIMNLLSADKKIDSNFIIGIKTKQEWIETSCIDSASFVTSSLLYTAIYVDNQKGTENYLGRRGNYVISKEYLETVKTSKKIDCRPRRKPCLEVSLNDANEFDEVFSKIKSEVIDFPYGSSEVHFYRLPIINRRFNFIPLKDYIRDFVFSYMYSRLKLNSYEEGGKIRRLVSDSIRELKNENTLEYNELIGDVLIYAFLEKKLNAPKILSSYEFSESSFRVNKYCSGIHLLKTKVNERVVFQLILGTVMIDSNIEEDIAHALDRANVLLANKDKFIRKIDETAVKLFTDLDTAQFIKKIIIPTKNDSRIAEVDIAFGIFIGYKNEVNPDVANAQYPAEFDNCTFGLAEEIGGIVKSQLEEKQLSGMPFYFYFVPFNDPEIDSKQVMEGVMNNE